MENSFPRFAGLRKALRFAVVSTVLLMLLPVTAIAGNAVKYALCDVRVVYIYEDPRTVDWPAVYYLNDMFGCRVDLVTAEERSRVETVSQGLDTRELYSHTLCLPGSDSSAALTLLKELFFERLPDIVIFGDDGADPLLNVVKTGLLQLTGPEQRLFNILKVYRKFDPGSDPGDSRGHVVLNGRELQKRYRDRMALELPSLFPRFDPGDYKVERIIRYRLLENVLDTVVADDNFLSGLSPLRVAELIDSLLEPGPMKSTLLQQAKKFISYFNASRLSFGQRQVTFIVDGYRELTQLNRHERVIADMPEFQAYLRRLLARAERAALGAVGVSWEGEIILRDSPHGPRLKFVASVSADGPREVELNGFYFHPYWDTVSVALESSPIMIAPHQSFTKEFLVDIDRSYLSGETPASLEFSVQVAYGGIPLTFTSELPIWQSPNLSINFEPDFHFVKPFPGLEVDRVVSNLNLKAVITKPYDYSGVAQLNLQTPTGLFAGAYRTDVQLEKGMLTETVRIPFTISNLFELGIQTQTIELLIDKKLVAADTGYIRVASCDIPDTVKVGFLPDSLGLLEDVLRMTEATYRPLTDRSLITADLEAYNVILIGSGSHRDYASLRLMKGRFEDYLRQGGSLVLFGQPEDWPGEILPVSFVPTSEVLTQDEITNRIPEARVLGRPYSISQKNLLSLFFRKQQASPAVISPAEKVLLTPKEATLLSVSRIGDGQIIFCGLPLLEMVTRLDIDAIHLFANLLNY
ncbi:MAG: hypothetical protein JSV52_00965 [Candidatus Zixiibacteriota bacterium]|nr:MAG: hypothetical protein JSV52_00965 [candidate division Zixibacteria bacterium]